MNHITPDRATISDVSSDRVTIGNIFAEGDFVGRDKIVHETHYHYVERSSPNVPYLVPNLPPHHIPRLAELAVLRDLLLDQNQVVAVTALRGMGGIGKTTLAIALCHDKKIIDAFSDGILWATLGPNADLLSIQTAWGTALGEDLTKLSDVEARASRLRSLLYSSRCLLIIDDVWDTLHLTPMQVGGPRCATLVTTRERKIAQKVGISCDLSVLEPEQAIAVLEHWSGETTKEDKAIVAELCNRLGYLPLALNLAGAQFQGGASWNDLLAVFRDTQQVDIDLLDLDDPTMRDESLALTFDLSLKRLGDTLPRLFAMLGVFAAGRENPFSAEAVANVWNTPFPNAKKMLDRLLRAALLDREDNNYTFHLLLGDYARGQLDNELRKDAEVRHSAYYLEIVKRSEKDWQTAEADMPQIRTAWRRIEAGDANALYAWAISANRFFNLRGLWDDKITWIKTALDAARAANQYENEGWCENELGSTYYHLGAIERALKHCQASLDIRRKIGDRNGEAITLNHIGRVYDRWGQWDIALKYFRNSLETIHNQNQDPIAQNIEIYARNQIGLIHQKRGELDLAMSQFEENLYIANDIGDKVNEAESLRYMGYIYNRRGTLDEAISAYEQSLAIIREIGDRTGETQLLIAIGRIYYHRDKLTEALEYLQASLSLAQGIRDQVSTANAMAFTGYIYLKLGELDKALDHFVAARTIREKLGDLVAMGHSLGDIGTAQKLRGKTEEALDYHKRSLALFQKTGNKRGEAAAHAEIGETLREQGKIEEAVKHLQAGLSTLGEMDPVIQGHLLWYMAQIYRQTEYVKEAEAYKAQALTLFQAMGMPEAFRYPTKVNLG